MMPRCGVPKVPKPRFFVANACRIYWHSFMSSSCGPRGSEVDSRWNGCPELSSTMAPGRQGFTRRVKPRTPVLARACDVLLPQESNLHVRVSVE
jgi:hypothetical protein